MKTLRTPTSISTADDFGMNYELDDFVVTDDGLVFGSLIYDVCEVLGPLVLI